MSESAVKVVRIVKSPSVSEDLSKVREEIREALERSIGLVIGASEGYSVEIKLGEKTTLYLVDIAQQQHFGRLLGSKGKNIGALRTLVGAMASVRGFRAIISIKDEDRFF
ncbi:hypothetical protein AZI86_11400 [Bdellovibrio bacteriovorus]|uniref:Uncharacterized protein n=1 Tax=Bdellovibrio bacteriovorus TaxID=959 RepID=A0A150WM72_BDEBC|nr:KH domain-containing protein [Bdellovibrio bacteriovorus]KYG64803.1 hypothetical protein AZI86_11400 [Bdellovibrio bacteriovorus]